MQDIQKQPRISVVIPTRNESENLYYVLPAIPTTIDEVILVDGHSSDDTIEVAEHLLPSIRIIRQTGKGKGDALRTGFAACTGDIIVTLDADGSADPAEIPLFVDVLTKGYDFAKGSRFMKGGHSHDITVLRYLGNHGLGLLVNVLFLTRFSDLCYGYNAFWRHCLDHITIDCDGFEIETHINLHMHLAKLKIAEVPSCEYPRIYGESNLQTFRDGWRVLQTIVKTRSRGFTQQLRPVSPRSLATSLNEHNSKAIVMKHRQISNLPMRDSSTSNISILSEKTSESA